MSGLWNWLNSNAHIVSSVASVAMAVIWIVYLHVALRTFIRQRRPRIVLDQAHGHGVRSVFMLINLSREPIHISCVLVAFNVGDDEEVYEITDFEHSNLGTQSDSPDRWKESLKHGPLQAGEFLILGGLPVDLIDVQTVAPSDTGDGQGKSLKDRFNETARYIQNFEIRVIGVFSAENQPVGACRKYRLEPGENREPRILPETDWTLQLNSRRDRQTLQQWGEECRST